MEKHIVSGETILFPFTPYKTQLILIDRILKAIHKEQNALLESPTGTGKTIAALSAVLSWRKRNKELKTPIIYASRTHSQLSQLVKELKSSPYHDELSGICLASRKHYCINSRATLSQNINHECKVLKSKGRCVYYHKVEDSVKSIKKNPIVLDIEELVGVSKQNHSCPYFTAKKLITHSNIIFCPYNYVLNPRIRKGSKIQLKDAILILDEAHNIDDVCREAASFDILISSFEGMFSEFELIMLGPHSSSHHILNTLIGNIVEWLQKSIHNFTPNPNMKSFEQQTQVWDSNQTQKILGLWGVSKESLKSIIEQVEEARTLYDDELTNSHDKYNANMKELLSPHAINILEELVDVFSLMYKNPDNMDSFQLAIQRNLKKYNNTSELVFTLSLWCMNPGVTFQSLAKCRSIIVMSGTLSPMDSFGQELNTTFPFQLQSQHITPKENTWIESIGNSPSGFELRANYENTDNIQFQDGIGDLLKSYIPLIPGGVLLFLPSYRLLFLLVKRWKQTNCWSFLTKYKKLYIEPQNGDDFQNIINQYYYSVEQENGAVLLAVCRGKVSEGINFTDNYARAVFVIGIPFSGIKDPKIILKKEYNTKYSRQKNLLVGSQWYAQQAFRALNQALGRCIRHKLDYGAIILIDIRFKSLSTKNQLSKWVRDRIQQSNNINTSINGIQNFFIQKKPDIKPNISTNMNESLVHISPNSNTNIENISRMYQIQKSYNSNNNNNIPQQNIIYGDYTDNKRKIKKLPTNIPSKMYKIPSLKDENIIDLESDEEDNDNDNSILLHHNINTNYNNNNVSLIDYNYLENISCKACDNILTNNYQNIEEKEIHINSISLQGWIIYFPNSNSIKVTIQPNGLWVPEDGVVYEQLYCKYCETQQHVGVKIVASNKINIQYIDSIILLKRYCTKSLIKQPIKRKYNGTKSQNKKRRTY